MISKIIPCLFFLMFAGVLTAQSDFKLKVSREGSAPLQLSLLDLSKMPHTNALLKDKQGDMHTYKGVLVLDILAKAGNIKEAHGEGFSKYLLVKCADGYRVLFSLAELDKDFTDKKVIIADSVDGYPLPEAKGPLRIIVEGEKKPARSSFQVVELIVGSVKD